MLGFFYVKGLVDLFICGDMYVEIIVLFGKEVGIC